MLSITRHVQTLLRGGCWYSTGAEGLEFVGERQRESAYQTHSHRPTATDTVHGFSMFVFLEKVWEYSKSRKPIIAVSVCLSDLFEI